MRRTTLNLSRLDFRRGTAHLTQLLAIWPALCKADLEYARAVLGTVRRSIPEMRCRIVTNDDLCEDVVNFIVGQRAVSAVAIDYLDRPALAELATDRFFNVAIVFYNGKFLPIIDDRVTDDIMRRWHMLDKDARVQPLQLASLHAVHPENGRAYRIRCVSRLQTQ